MSPDWLVRFRRRGAVADGHFLLSSGLHSPIYVQSALILQYPEEAQALGAALAERLRPLRPQVVIGPALGAVVVAHEVARALGVRAIFAERDGGQMALRRGFTIAVGERVLVVEDVVTTGGSAAEVASLVRAAGGAVVGFGALVDRTGGRMDLKAHLEALITLDLPTFAPDRCPQCREGVPVRKPGSRATPG
ncbi:MAG: orotate phosphoribosyltransferase [bacterium]|nr:orotate phosphoribosyltransferase [bacterium]